MKIDLIDLLTKSRRDMTEKDMVDLVRFSLEYCADRKTLQKIERLVKQICDSERDLFLRK